MSAGAVFTVKDVLDRLAEECGELAAIAEDVQAIAQSLVSGRADAEHDPATLVERLQALDLMTQILEDFRRLFEHARDEPFARLTLDRDALRKPLRLASLGERLSAHQTAIRAQHDVDLF